VQREKGRATKKQLELLEYIKDFLKDHDYAPSYREIMAALQYKSVSTVAVHVDGLIATGYLTKSDKSARSIRIADTTANVNDYSDHLRWLRQEAAKYRSIAADSTQADILQKAVDILSSEK
jgi:SOS-response transcriptional repressor LexA